MDKLIERYHSLTSVNLLPVIYFAADVGLLLQMNVFGKCCWKERWKFDTCGNFTMIFIEIFFVNSY